ncbi:hypothetical protein ABE607_16185 [Comamonas aquatica]|uniref:hypothetical protein n=1 Tax=Comamonas aquatica TaxID=225991 RepID=UPI003209E9E0
MKKLFSPFQRVIPIALTSGHTFVVTQEPVEVPDMYVAEAVARGAAEAAEQFAPVVQAAAAQEEGLTTQATAGPVAEELALLRAAKIAQALNGMLDGANEADFTEGGKPQLARVKALVGFTVTRAEVDAAWAEVSAAV